MSNIATKTALREGGAVTTASESQQEPLAETEVLIQFSNREDAETAYKVLVKQCGNPEQTMSGLYASLLRSAVQRAQRVEIGEVCDA
jgi:hypothetical protein